MAKSSKTTAKKVRGELTKALKGRVVNHPKSAAVSVVSGRFVVPLAYARSVSARLHPSRLSPASQEPSVSVSQNARPADPSLLDPYDWGPGGIPKGKPLKYIPGKGFDFGDF